MKNPGQDACIGLRHRMEREERSRKLINVEIETEAGAKFSANVTNLSASGMGARASGILQPFETVSVTKKGYGRVYGEVRWVDGQYFGVLFSEPVNVEMFNFSCINSQGHFVPKVNNGHIWKGFEVDATTKRPGVTSRFSRCYSKRKFS